VAGAKGRGRISHDPNNQKHRSGEQQQPACDCSSAELPQPYGVAQWRDAMTLAKRRKSRQSPMAGNGIGDRGAVSNAADQPA
jgi:hypothetical protein